MEILEKELDLLIDLFVGNFVSATLVIVEPAVRQIPLKIAKCHAFCETCKRTAVLRTDGSQTT
jgi:hypothetical protein